MSLRKQIKSIGFYAINAIFQKRYLKKIQEHNHLTILNLHRVSPQSNTFYPPLHPELFEELIVFLKKHFNIITFRDIEAYQNSKKPNVILSFDDGFKDYIEYAVPIMDKYNVISNQNIIPHCVENNEAVWDVRFFDFLNCTPLSLINEIDMPEFQMKINETNRIDYGLAFMTYLKSKSKLQREELFDILNKTIEKNQDIRFTQMMNRKEVLEVSTAHEVGAHTYSHESMNLESRIFFEEDFKKCKQYFNNVLDLPLDIYAFPSGRYEKYQLDFLEEHGIRHILLVEEQYSNNETNCHHRFTYYADTVSEVKMRALGYHV